MNQETAAPGAESDPPGQSAEVDGIVFGTRLRGSLPVEFRPYLLPLHSELARCQSRSLDLTYRRVATVPALEEIWESFPGGPNTPGRLTLSRLGDGYALTVAGDDRGLIRCTPRSLDIEWIGSAASAAHHLFAYALPLWLESRGVPVLHGSAVSVGDRAVGFVAPTGTGKSVLCAELVRRGCTFLADDALALESASDGGWCCLHGPPMLRIWPSGLRGRLALSPEPLPRVYAAGDKRRLPLRYLGPTEPLPRHRLPLAALFVLHRRAETDGAVRLEDCGPRQALVRLVEHGVAAAPAAALGWAGRRLEALASLVEAVPVRHLHYPSGSDTATAEIVERIERDLDLLAKLRHDSAT